MKRLRERLEQATGGASIRPLVVLSALFFFDEFDSSAFSVLAPNIKRAFGLSDHAFATVVIVNLSVVLLLAIPAGHLGDRGPRRLLAVGFALGGSVFSLLTGFVGTLTLLVIVRIANGIGNLSNGTFQRSLLADYYAPEFRSNVFAVYLSMPGLGAIFGGVVAGSIASAFGWRAPFFIFFIPVVLLSFVVLGLREPLRGETDDPQAAADVAEEEPPKLTEAARMLWAIPTLRRQYIAFAFIGAGLLPLSFTIPLFFEREFGMGEFGRGLLVSVYSALLLAGTIFIGPRTRKWVQRDVGEPLRWVGAFTIAVGVLIVVMAIAPAVWMSIVVMGAAYFIAGMYLPPFVTVQSLVAPARARTLAFAFGSLFLVGGVVVLYLLLPTSSLSDTRGIRVGIAALGPYWLIAGLILATASRFVADDAASALRSLAALAALRRRRVEHGDAALLVCSGVDVAYDSVQVLFGVDFDVEEGEIVALLGTNGAGKSTLLKSISGLIPPSAGSIVFEGHDMTYADPKSKFEAGIVQMPGGRSIFPSLTVEECLRLAAWTNRDPGHVAELAEQVLEYFPILNTRMDTLAGDLSGGEQQMLGLGMAFISRPKLLMIDELSLGLAPAIVSRLTEIVRAIHAQGTTIVIVEQSVNVALTLAKRAVFMEKGEIRFTGPTAELLRRGDILRAVFLEGAAKTLGATNGSRPNFSSTRAAATRRRRALKSGPVLELEDVSVHYGGIRAVDGVSLTLHTDEVLGLIGPNGAGKTTLFDAVSGLVSSTGTMMLGGVDIASMATDQRARVGLGRSFQDARIFPSMTVVENLAVALERHLEVRDPIACALGLPAVFESESNAAWRVHELVELLGLEAYRNKFVGELSTGTRRIVDLGMAIAHRPNVLLLDEPSSGIAQRETEALGPLLKQVQAEVGCALLVIEHDMPLITSIADTLIALESGAVVAEGTPHRVVHDPRVIASYLGTDQAAIFRSGRRTTRAKKSRVRA